MRIIAGKHKNRIVPTIRNANYRPSTSKFREAIFNILSSGEFVDQKPVEGASVLDLFSGSGALSFEALSRGAGKVTLVDVSAEHMKEALAFAKKIGESDNVTGHIADATMVRLFSETYSLVFIDPPYKTKYFKRVLNNLDKNGCLDKGAIIVVEMSKYEDLEILPNFPLVKEKVYGNNKLLVLRYE